MDYKIEELNDFPQEWIDLLNSMPEIKDEFIEDKLCNEEEMIPPYFFSYFSDNYTLCKPYFLCFERGEEVFNNLLRLSNEKTYDISNIKFEETTYESLKKEYNISDIEEVDIKDACADIIWSKVLPDENENPYAAYVELWENGIKTYIINDELVKYTVN